MRRSLSIMCKPSTHVIVHLACMCMCKPNHSRRTSEKDGTKFSKPKLKRGGHIPFATRSSPEMGAKWNHMDERHAGRWRGTTGAGSIIWGPRLCLPLFLFEMSIASHAAKASRTLARTSAHRSSLIAHLSSLLCAGLESRRSCVLPRRMQGKRSPRRETAFARPESLCCTSQKRQEKIKDRGGRMVAVSSRCIM